jgi:hypothetical protein
MRETLRCQKTRDMVATQPRVARWIGRLACRNWLKKATSVTICFDPFKQLLARGIHHRAHEYDLSLKMGGAAAGRLVAPKGCVGSLGFNHSADPKDVGLIAAMADNLHPEGQAIRGEAEGSDKAGCPVTLKGKVTAPLKRGALGP